MLEKSSPYNTPEENMQKNMRAFMMLLTMNNSSLLPIFAKKRKKEVISHLCDLGLCDVSGNAVTITDDALLEHRDLADCYIKSCTSCKTYGSAFLGMIPMPDRNIALKIAGDIDTALRLVPASYDMGSVAKPLLEVFIETYKNLLEGGEELWADYAKNHSNYDTI